MSMIARIVTRIGRLVHGFDPSTSRLRLMERINQGLASPSSRIAKDAVASQVNKILSRYQQSKNNVPDSSARDSSDVIALDEIDKVELILDFEDEFKVSISDRQMTKMESKNDAVNIITDCLKDQSGLDVTETDQSEEDFG
eukprot:TRINITY_DN4374_c0_g1_i1.p1 TRINITY_DN4374_c0_g1~~TRINITY_DN4374_c0_g1_i1.p1  ORF type:complete len:148 (+),score=20.97 TRINITY_DN4374_c0_g1_i1:22-444(+)